MAYLRVGLSAEEYGGQILARLPFEKVVKLIINFSYVRKTCKLILVHGFRDLVPLCYMNGCY